MGMDAVCRLGHGFFEQIERLHRMICMQKMFLKLNPAEMMMLIQVERCLEENPKGQGVKPSQLTAGGMLSKPAVSKMLGNLEEKGYLMRTASKGDRRVVYVNLTKLGTERLKEEREYRDQKIRNIINSMGRENMEMLSELMEGFLACVKKELAK